MSKQKKSTKKGSAVATQSTSNWFNIDKSIDNLRKEMEKAFSSFPAMNMPKMPHTSCDIIDEGKQFKVKMDAPGIKKNEINLNVTENSIEITGEHKEEEKKKNYLRKERHSMSYYQTIPFSEKIIPGKAKAKLTDGVLEVILPKKKPTPTPKKRAVKVQ